MSAVVEARNLTYRYPRGRGISGILFDASPGEVVCIFGLNGAGKTTLFRVLSTLVLPQAGSLSIGGWDAVRYREQARRNIFPAFDSSAHFGHLTGRENARFFLNLYGISRPGDLDGIADRFGLDLDQVAGEYSLGMKRKLLLSECLASQKEVLMFDEPTLGLDSGMRPVFFEQVREAAEAGSCILICTNRIEDAACADRILLLDSGTISPVQSADALAARMIRVTITMEDRRFVEYIPVIDELPELVKKILSVGTPRSIEIGGTGSSDPAGWTPEAEEKLRRAPPFLQGMIRSLVERYARECGHRRITTDVVDEARARFEQR